MESAPVQIYKNKAIQVEKKKTLKRKRAESCRCRTKSEYAVYWINYTHEKWKHWVAKMPD